MKNIILRAFTTKVLALMVLGASGGPALADVSCGMPPLTNATNAKLTPCNASSTLHWYVTNCDASASFKVT
ncbi:MAG: hypothetical protein NT154_18215, partial [Verrucomicrobia bacterium]|nr:hypothetical protein [Verrucomicrobiota bacterium]